MHRSHRPSIIATIFSGMLLVMLAATVAAAPPTGSSKSVSVIATGLTGLGEFEVSAGQSIPLSIKVANDGKQSINSVVLKVGRDGDPTTAANGDANPPINLPAGVTASAQGCGPAGPILVCDIGTLRAGRSVTFNVVLSIAENAGAIATFTKATVTVAEGGNDSGSNLDAFSIEGALTVLAFSCESTSVYRPSGSVRAVETCELTDSRNVNKQRATVTLPTGLTTMTLKENAGVACPVVSGLTCIGDEVEADIFGDDSADTVRWVIEIQLLDGAKVTLSKLVIYHYDDDGNLVEAISLNKRNACKSASAQGCGSAEIVDGVLIVTFQSQGNGRTRLLG